MEQKNIYGFEMIQKKDIAKILRNGRVWIIDLRTPEKYREAHYPAARNFPFAYIDTWKNEIPENIYILNNEILNEKPSDICVKATIEKEILERFKEFNG